jgi:hypothetical protein
MKSFFTLIFLSCLFTSKIVLANNDRCTERASQITRAVFVIDREGFEQLEDGAYVEVKGSSTSPEVTYSVQLTSNALNETSPGLPAHWIFDVVLERESCNFVSVKFVQVFQ